MKQKPVSEAVDRDNDYIKKLEFLSDSSLYFLKNASYESIFSYIAESLYKLTGAIVVISEYDPGINSTIVRSIKINKQDQRTIAGILNQKIIGLTLVFDNNTRKKFISGKLSKLKDGLCELTFYRFPKGTCKFIEKALHIGEIYAMAFVVEKDFLGTVALITRKDLPLNNLPLIEAFINQSAIALKRIQSERELTELKNKMQEEKERLQHLEQKKDEFIAIASHELKTPLTSVKVYAQLLQKNYVRIGNKENFKMSRLLESLISELSKIEKLVNDMLDVSKIEKGKLVYAREEVDLDDLIERTIENFRLSNPVYTFIKKGKCKNTIIGDENRLQQVIINLFSNAVKYSNGSKKIVVIIKNLNREVVVGIQDFGIGISEEHQKKIFGRCYRVDEKARQGFGLGLYIAAEIIKRHG